MKTFSERVDQDNIFLSHKPTNKSMQDKNTLAQKILNQTLKYELIFYQTKNKNYIFDKI